MNTSEPTITLHFTHGSVYRSIFKKNPRPTTGGLLGGHIVIEIGNHVYGFDNKKNPIYVFHGTYKNSYVVKEEVFEWKIRTVNDMLSGISLEISHDQYERMQKLLDEYVIVPPFSYSFFGFRCFAFILHIFSRSGYIKEMHPIKQVLIGFVPPLSRVLIKKIVKEKTQEKLEYIKQGETTRIWENF